MGMLLISLAIPPVAADDESNISKLRVDGEGKVTAAPDMATIVLGVESRSTKAAEAVEENARLMNQTINALLEAGIIESQMQTSRFSLTTMPQDEPLTAKAEQEPPVFLATNQVTVKLDDTEGVGRVLDAAVGAGSNSIQEVRFDLKDPTPQNDEAMTISHQGCPEEGSGCRQCCWTGAGQDPGDDCRLRICSGGIKELFVCNGRHPHPARRDGSDCQRESGLRDLLRL